MVMSGISRTVTIDTMDGKRFGNHLKDSPRGATFLKRGEVMLSFDDGPSSKYTPGILKVLEKHGLKATFFMVGESALKNPELAKAVKLAGHTIASHSFSHADMRKLSPNEQRDQIEMGISAITKAVGGPISPFFRFPYLSDTSTAMDHLKSRNLAAFGIHADSLDWKTKDPDKMTQNVLADLEKKGSGIILCHDIQQSTAAGLDHLLTQLKEQGYKFVHAAPKEMAQTLPKYDDIIAQRYSGRNMKFAADSHNHHHAHGMRASV